MPLIIPPGYAQAVFNLSLDGDSEPMVTTLGLDVGAVAGSFEDAADSAFSAFGLGPLAMMANVYTLTHVTLYVGQDGGPPAIYDSTVTGAVGGLSSAPLPQNCAWLARKRTDAAGRRGRGRMYIPGVQENEVSAAGVISNTWVSAMQDQLDIFMAELVTPTVGTESIPPVILHRSEGIGTEPPPTPITTLVCDSRIATQRRRLRS